METIITFVRHGENINSKPAQIWHPGPKLTKEGKNQAEKTGKYLKNFQFDKIFSSDMNRAMQTTNVIIKHLKNSSNASVSFHRNLSEHDELFYDGPKGGKKFLAEKAKAERTVNFFKKILKEYAGKNILISAHGNVIRACIGTSLGFSLHNTPKLHLLNCSISTLLFNKEEVDDIYYLNSVSHYRKMRFVDKLVKIKYKTKS